MVPGRVAAPPWPIEPGRSDGIGRLPRPVPGKPPPAFPRLPGRPIGRLVPPFGRPGRPSPPRFPGSVVGRCAMPGSDVVGRSDPMPGRGTFIEGAGRVIGIGRAEAFGSEGRCSGEPPANPGRCMFGICGAGRCIGICICGAGRVIGICICGRCTCWAGRFMGICGAGRVIGIWGCCTCAAGRLMGICGAGRAIGAAGRAIGAAGLAIGAAGRAPPPPTRPRCATAGAANPVTRMIARMGVASP